MKKYLLIPIIFFFSFSNSYSLDTTNIEEDNEKWLNHRVGFYGSSFSGYGLSYQYQFDNGLSIRNQFIALNTIRNEKVINYGIDLQNNIAKSDMLRFYYIIGAGLAYYENYDEFDNETDYNCGTGFGLEVMVWQNFSFAVELGFSGQLSNKRYTDQIFKDGKYQYLKVDITERYFNFGGGFGIFIAI